MDITKYCKTARGAKLAGVTPAWWRTLCRTGRVRGAAQVDGEWLAPVAEADRVGSQPEGGQGRPRAARVRAKIDRKGGDSPGENIQESGKSGD